MRRWKWRRIAPIAFLLVLAHAQRAPGALITAVSETGGTLVPSVPYNYEVMLAFTPTTNLELTSVGIFDTLQSPSANRTGISLTVYGPGGSQLEQVGLPNGNSTPLQGGFLFTTLPTPLLLQSGMTYEVASFAPSGTEGIALLPSATFAPELGNVIFGNNGEGAGPEYLTPINSLSNYPEFGPNFQFTLAAVPEPSTLTQAAIAGAFVSTFLWRRIVRRRQLCG